MIDIDRRTAAMFALLAPFAVGSAGAQTPKPQAPTPDVGHDMSMTEDESGKVHWMGNEQIAMLM